MILQVLYDVDFEPDPLPNIQALLLMSCWYENPNAMVWPQGFLFHLLGRSWGAPRSGNNRPPPFQPLP